MIINALGKIAAMTVPTRLLVTWLKAGMPDHPVLNTIRDSQDSWLPPYWIHTDALIKEFAQSPRGGYKLNARQQVFTLDKRPKVGTEMLWINGCLCANDDYTIASHAIIFHRPAEEGDVLTVNYEVDKND